MAIYRQIHIKIWSSPDFQGLSLDGKLTFIHLFSNSHRNESALYRITPKTISNETDIPIDRTNAALNELADNNLIKYDCDEHIVWVINAIKYQKMSPNEVTSIMNDLERLSHPYGEDLKGYYKDLLSTYQGPTKDLKRTSKGPSGKGNTKGKSKSNTKAKELDQRFNLFWNEYPRKIAKQDAARAFSNIDILSDDLFAKIIDALKKAKVSQDWTKEAGKYIPYPATWLNGRRWEDILEKPLAKPQPEWKPPLINALGGKR